MVKKNVKLTIDEDLLERAKQDIPNLSQWVEECLKAYFGYGDYPVKCLIEMEDNLRTVKRCLLEIHMQTNAKKIERELKEMQSEQINLPWRRFWYPYQEQYDDQKFNDKALHDLSDATGKDEAELKRMAETLFWTHKSIVNPIETFDEAWKLYKEEEEEYWEDYE